MLDVFFSEAAIRDLEEIRDYIAADNPDAAHRLLDDIEETCHRFGQHPRIGVARDDLLPGIRLFPVRKTYAVFYRIQDDAVEIVRVVNGRRDFNRLFDSVSP
jgi:toxin ParE1/3/4